MGSDKLSLYQLLGFLVNTQAGSYDPKSGTLQIYYDAVHFTALPCQRKIEGLQKIAKAFIREYGLVDDFRLDLETLPTGQTKVALRSENICYVLEQIAIRIGPITKSSAFSRRLPAADIDQLFAIPKNPSDDEKALAEKQRLAFLTGAFYSHQAGDGVWVLHELLKMRMLYTFISELAEEEDKLVLYSKFCIPNSHKLALNEEGPLWGRIKAELEAG